MKRAIILERQLKPDIAKDLEVKRISLIIGARQIGKATLLKQILSVFIVDLTEILYYICPVIINKNRTYLRS